MSARLTDEQLEAIAKDHESAWPESIEDMAAEIIALRAERAKPTPSDEKRLRGILRANGINGAGPVLDDVLVLISSIRAEGSAEREKLQERYDCNTAIMHARTKALRDSEAERAKLEAALRDVIHNDDGVCEQIALRALAQPAESGATGLMHDKTDAWDFEHAKRRVIEQTEHGFVARDIGAKP